MNTYRRLILMLGLGLLLISPAVVWADGTVLTVQTARTANYQLSIPKIPSQQAIIHFYQQHETLILQTQFQGQGQDFLWVVPLPSIPTIRAVKNPRIFQQIRGYRKTRTVGIGSLWILICWLLGLPIIIIVCYQNVSPLLLACWRIMRTLLILVGCLFIMILFLPALSGGGGGYSGTGAVKGRIPNVTVHQAFNLGVFEIKIVSASDNRDFIRWLKFHHYYLPAPLETELKHYIKKKWTFSLCRMRDRFRQVQLRAVPALSFSFSTPRAIYPLALTSHSGSDTSIELLVFAAGRSKARYFRTLYAASMNDMRPCHLTDISTLLGIRTNKLRRSSFLTHLYARLRPSQMQHDLFISTNGWRFTHNYYIYPRCLFWGMLTALVISSLLFYLFWQRRSWFQDNPQAWYLGLGYSWLWVPLTLHDSLFILFYSKAPLLKPGHPPVLWLTLGSIVYFLAMLSPISPESKERLREQEARKVIL